MKTIYRLLIVCLLPLHMAHAASGQSFSATNDPSEPEKAAWGDIHDLMTGKISGVRISQTDGSPNSMPVISIRGISSLRTSGYPLYIVDGVILNDPEDFTHNAFWQYGEDTYTSTLNPLAFLSTYDIERIEVLKNQTATALYGSKGASGVILITTRKAASDEMSIDWNSSLTVAPAISHSHAVNFGSSLKGLDFNISAFFRDRNHAISNLSSTYGGGRMNLSSSGNSPVRFGVTSIFSIGNSSSPTGCAYFGRASQTLAMRDETFFNTDLKGWTEDYDDNNKEVRSLNSAFLSVNLGNLVKWTTRAGMDFSKDLRVIWSGNGTPFGLKNNGAAAETGITLLSYNASTGFEYEQFIADKHKINASITADAYGNINFFNTMNGVNFMTHELRGDGLSMMQCEKQIHRFDLNHLNIGAVASAGWEYDGIVGINAGTRAEMTPKYNDEITYYPYAEGSIDLHKALFKDNRSISSLRLNGGWGKSGKESVSPYELCGDILTGAYPAVEKGAEPYHEGLGRLMSSGWNISLQTGFADDRILVEAGFYKDDIDDRYEIWSSGRKRGEYWEKASPEMLWSRSSSFTRCGVEIDLEAVIMQRRSFKWRINANASFEKNSMTATDPEDLFGKSLGNGIVANTNALSQCAGAIYGYQENPDGTLKDTNRDTRINMADKVILGNPLPAVYGSVAMAFDFYGISIDLLMNGCAGHQIVNLNTLALSGKTDITSSCIEDGDYLRLSRASVGYDIPLHLKWLKRLNINLSATNLFTLTAYSGWNPDVNCFGTVSRGGCDYGSFPLNRYITVGICAKF